MAADHPEFASLLHVSRVVLHPDPRARRVRGDVVYRRVRHRALRYRRRNFDSRDQRRLADRIHARMPFAAQPRRWQSRYILELAAALQMLELRDSLQRAAHELRLVQFVLGFVLRLLRPDVLDGNFPRFQSVVLMAEY